MRERVVVGMSGGVDSSVTAALLVQAGYDVVGISMRLWNAPVNGRASGCCSLDDFLDARRVAHRLGIPYYVMDFQPEFEDAVVRPFVSEYARGRTPNPCVRCNQYVKFGSFWERARALGASAVATGHYARVVGDDGGHWRLCRAADASKDQSYFLFTLRPCDLSHTLFPLGGLRKDEVRALAAELRLPVATKPDSQEVCFAPGRSYASFVARRLGKERPAGGDIIDQGGGIVGRHGGIHTVTIGQRRGLGLGGPQAQYVVSVDPRRAAVRVGPRQALVTKGLEANEANWLVPQPPSPGTALMVKVRSRHPGTPVRLLEASAHHFVVEAPQGLNAVTPGQAAVLYDGDAVIGGGWIARALGDREGMPS